MGGGGNGNAGSKQEMGRALHPSSTTESGVDITQGGTATSTSPPGGLPTKTDLVVWLHLKPIQLQLYEVGWIDCCGFSMSTVQTEVFHPFASSKHAHL